MHYLTIQQALQFGCKLLKVRKVISFNQEPFSKKFLQMMTLRRKNSASKFKKRMCKGIVFLKVYYHFYINYILRINDNNLQKKNEISFWKN